MQTSKRGRYSFVAFLLLFLATPTAESALFKWRYSVTVKNTGPDWISVSPFFISGNTEDDKAGIGECNPSPQSAKSFGLFYKRPLRDVEIVWKNQRTEKMGRAKVKLDLPKTFTRKSGANIIFIIHPDENKVDVEYGLRD